MFNAQGVGTLKEVLVHFPKDALVTLNPQNLKDHFFDGLPRKDIAVEEFQKFVKTLAQAGVKVNHLADLIKDKPFLSDMLKKLPNTLFIRDLAVITSEGAVISNMRYPARAVEPVVAKSALTELGIEKILCEITPPGLLEGGDVLFLDADTMLVGRSMRTNEDGIRQLAEKWLTTSNRIVAMVPIEPARSSMHLDSVMGIISRTCVCIHSPSIEGNIRIFQNKKGALEKDEMQMGQFLRVKRIEPIEVTSAEQWNMACNILMVEPNKKIICYRRSFFEESLNALKERSIEPLMVDSPELAKGAGGPHCMTLELKRERE